MQQQHYTAAELTGDETFPTHLTQRQAIRLINEHDHKASAQGDGSIRVQYWCSKGGEAFKALKWFTPSLEHGLYRAAAILLWLGY